MYDIVIIGAGTAGLTAAIYGVRAGKSVLVFEAENYGGQIINSQEVENYPGIKNISGYEFATNLYEQAISLGAEIKFAEVTGIKDDGCKKYVMTEKGEIESKTVILATGAKNRPLGLVDEQKYIGAGVSYCATCDGAFFKGKDVAVVGGGNTALEDAMFLSGYCKKVYLVHRRNSFRGEDKLAGVLMTRENVEFVLESKITKLLGGDFLEGIVVQGKEGTEEKTIAVQGLFIAIGKMPNNMMFEDLVELDQSGYIKAAEDCKTNREGVFTAGDCRTKSVRQLTTAAADGAVAGLAACEYI